MTFVLFSCIMRCGSALHLRGVAADIVLRSFVASKAPIFNDGRRAHIPASNLSALAALSVRVDICKDSADQEAKSKCYVNPLQDISPISRQPYVKFRLRRVQWLASRMHIPNVAELQRQVLREGVR